MQKLDNDDDKIRKQEQQTNLYCGAAFGVAVALGCIFGWGIVSLSWRILMLFLLPVAFVVIAMGYGDRFWKYVPKWLFWFGL